MAGRRAIFKDISDAEVQTRITAALDSLVAVGVSPVDAEPATIYGLGFDITNFEKHVAILKEISDRKVIHDLLVTYSRKHMVFDPYKITSRDIIKICTWIRSFEGQTELRSIQRLHQLKKLLEEQGKDKYSAQEVAWKKLFDVHNMDLANKSKQVREAYEKKIAGLIAAVEEERDASLERITKTYPVASSFKWPPDHEMNRRSLVLYEADCRAKGVPTKPRTNGSIIRAATEYVEDAKEEYVYQHIATADARKKLEEWGNKFIKHLESKKEMRTARSFRAYLATATGKKDAEVGAGDLEEGSEREASFENILQKVLGIGDSWGAAEEGGDREPTPTEPVEEHCGGKRKSRHTTRVLKASRKQYTNGMLQV